MKAESRIERVISSRQGVGLTASVLQRSDLVLHTFVNDHPAVILLRRGRKTVKVGARKVTLHPGDAIAFAAGTICEVQNETDRGQFESTWIVCAAQILAKIEQTFPDSKKLQDFVALKGLGQEFTQSFDQGIRAIAETRLIPRGVAENRAQEVLIWLAHRGFVFDPDEPTDLHRQVRLMVGAAPAKNWVSKEVAESFAMSEATLRRRLADQDHSFNAILIDVRMTTALTLLQVTDSPVAEIAYKVGYDSPSRFAVRFKKHFGFSPTAVRGV